MKMETETEPEEEEDIIVMPGDIIEEAMKTNKKVILGPGIRYQNENVVACKSGILRKKIANVCTFWIDSYQKRYVPIRGESVVGIVIAKAGDIFRVDIGSSEPASISYLAFEAATKKNRPDVNVGDILFAKLLIANRDLEPELICVDSNGKKGKLGVLNEGFVFNCSINLIRKILNKSCPLLNKIRKEWAYEIAAGMNGKIWIRGRTVKETLAIGNCILATEYITNEEINDMCENIGYLLKKHF